MVFRTIRFAISTNSLYKEHSFYLELLRLEPGLGDLRTMESEEENGAGSGDEMVNGRDGG